MGRVDEAAAAYELGWKDAMSQEHPPERGDERMVTNARTGGKKGTKLARFDLIPARPMWEVAELYGRGARKYEDRNWEKGYDYSLSIAALERHLNLYKQGEDYDPEGQHHLASVVFHALALIEFGETHPELDDRSVVDRQVKSDPAEAEGPAITEDPAFVQPPQRRYNPNLERPTCPDIEGRDVGTTERLSLP